MVEILKITHIQAPGLHPLGYRPFVNTKPHGMAWASQDFRLYPFENRAGFKQGEA